MDVGSKITIATKRHVRRADRRAGLDLLMRSVASDLIQASDRRNLAVFLTQRLAQVARMRNVGLKEMARSTSPRALQPVRSRDYVAYVVPVKEKADR